MRLPILTTPALLLWAAAGAFAQAPTAAPSSTPPAAPAASTPSAAANAPAAAATAPAGSVLLQYKFHQGEELKYNITIGSNLSLAMGAQAMPITVNSTMVMDQSVQSVDAQGDATIVAKAENPKMTMMMNGNPMPMPPSAMNQLAAGFTEVISPLGKVLSMQANTPVGQNGEAAPGLPMQNMFSPGQLGNMSALPDHPVKPGDTWRSSATMGAVGMQMFVKMTLLGIDASSGSPLANIALKYYADFTPNGTAGAPPLRGTMTGTGTGTFDVDRGLMLSTSAAMAMNMSMGAPAGAPTGPGNMKMNMTMQMNLISSD